jgi:hypothetical protein
MNRNKNEINIKTEIHGITKREKIKLKIEYSWK